MKIIGWVLIALGLCAPLLTIQIMDANRAAAGYTSATGYETAIVAIIVTIVMNRGKTKQYRGRAWLISGAIVLAACLWSSFNIAQGARTDREILQLGPK